MIHYRLPDGTLMGIDKGQENFIKKDWVKLTKKEFEALKNPALSKEDYIKKGQNLAEKHIQKVIDKYNADHGLSFKDVYSCIMWVDDAGYEHKQFCIDAVAFYRAVWKEVRNVILPNIDFSNPPTESEFIAMLPKYSGTM